LILGKILPKVVAAIAWAIFDLLKTLVFERKQTQGREIGNHSPADPLSVVRHIVAIRRP
jgi:hypothetical protein